VDPVALAPFADDEQLHVLVARPLLEQPESRDQALHVLVGLDVPRVEHEPAADLVALAHPVHLLLAGVRQQGHVDGVGHHLDAVGVGVGVEAQDVAARGLGDGEHQRAAPDGAAHHEPRVLEGHAVGQVLGEEQMDAVVDGHHRRAAAEQRQHVVGGMQQVGAQTMELAGDGDVLGEAVAVRLVHHRHEVLGQVAQLGLVRLVAEEEIGGDPVQGRQMAHQVPHIGPDAVVPPFAGVDRDLHRAGALVRLRWVVLPPMMKTRGHGAASRWQG
jgi:hypothetical protein